MSKPIKIILTIAAIILIALPMCYQAYINKLFVFDEGYYFIAANELGERGRFFIFFDPTSHLQNTKPYLFVFIQTLFGKCFGWNEWSLRIPIIASAVTLILLIYFSIKRIVQDHWWALTSAAVLLLIPYFVCPHMAFTGDHDVPLILFTTGFIFFYYSFLVEPEKNTYQRYLLWAILFATLSILTKGWMIVFFLPASFVFLFLYKKHTLLFTNGYFWMGMVFSILALASWYLGREYLDPGYLEAVWTYEIGRYHTFIEPVHPEWNYYWKILFEIQLHYWVLGFIPAAIFLLKKMNGSQNKFIYYILVQALAFLCIFSFSKVKLLWYDAPILPLCAVIIGFGIFETFKRISTFFYFQQRIVIGILFTLVFSVFYIQIFTRSFSRFYMESYGDFMVSKQTDIPYSIAYAEYNPHLLFYEQYATRFLKQSHVLKKRQSSFQVGEKILVCEPVLMFNIKRKYEYETIDSLGKSVFIQIKKSRAE
ncbi:ArnT family glycosyltransferase [Cytophaga aurantiaca]|uniref:ArnT family glycosyltransferase n=1 Tax=Cytophaga aurantiaca TaxID=29530 RepID=UPI00036EF418|nr:glycosyltransferase family 39 protein [Cytophaga aurantiaca]